MESIENNRNFLKAQQWDELKKIKTDQQKKIPQPQPQKPYPEDTASIDLVKPENLTLGNMSLLDAINRRKSQRKFTDESLTLDNPGDTKNCRGRQAYQANSTIWRFTPPF